MVVSRSVAVGLLLALHCAGRVDGNEHFNRLKSDLLQGANGSAKYDKLNFPGVSIDEPLEISLSFALRQILAVQENEQTITISTWQRQSWTDYKLRWDPTKYGGLDRLYLPANEVWVPDVYLYDAVTSDFVEREDFFVRASSEGNIIFLFKAIYKASCTFNMTDFPFDTQTCTFKWGSWAFTGQFLNITTSMMPRSTVETMEGFLNNEEWDLLNLTATRHVDTYSCCETNPLGNTFPTVIHTLTIRRKPLYYVYHLILPSVLIVCLSAVGLFSSPSGTTGQDVVSLGLTTMLAMAILELTVASRMPITSDVVPRISTFLATTRHAKPAALLRSNNG